MNYNNDNMEIKKCKQQQYLYFDERKVIANMLRVGIYTLDDIAEVLTRSKGNIHKEIIRNGQLKPHSARLHVKII
ncbi:MAG: helix-turn-helix domain-containing protein [Mycoplasmatales bacterium]